MARRRAGQRLVPGVGTVTVADAKILYVITDLHVGGVPLHLHRLALAMRQRGFRPAVVSLAGIGPVGAVMQRDGIEVIACQARGGWDVRVIPRLARLLHSRRPDIVHSLLFHANLASRLAARLAGFDAARLICEIQTVEVERRWHLWLDRLTCRACRCTVGNSASVVEHLATAAGIPRSRLRFIRGGIDPGPWQAAGPASRAALGVPDGAGLLLWVGRLDPVKGLESLIDAVASLRRTHDVYLLLAGEGAHRGALTARVTATALGDRVRFLGVHDDVPALLKAADAFVLPSQTEGLPNALLEAMAAGCPIVATDVPGCRDLVTHEREGLLVPFGDRDALAAALARLLDDRPFARRLAAQAARSASESWHLSATHDAYARLYAEALSPPTLSS